MTVKDEVRAILEKLPEDATLEDVQYHLYVADLLRRRARMLDQASAAELVPHSEVKKRFERWLTR